MQIYKEYKYGGRAVLLARFLKKLLYNLVASRFAFAVGTVGLTAVESRKRHDARHGAAHHAKPPNAAAETCGNAFCEVVAESVDVGESRHH